jgi:hypothetical protein
MFSVLNVVALNENLIGTQEFFHQEDHIGFDKIGEHSLQSFYEIPVKNDPTSLSKINHTGVKYDSVFTISVDSQDNIFAGGSINEPTWDYDYGYVSKLKPNGEIQWTYFFENSTVSNMAINSQDNIIVSGVTHNSDLPTTSGAFDRTLNSGQDFFIAKLNPIGQIVWCTYLGGNDSEAGYFVGIAVDSQDNIVFTGRSVSTDFPTKSAIQAEKSLQMDTVVSKFNTDGELRWSTFLGETGYDKAQSVAIDQEDNIYIAGRTNSIAFPTTYGAYQLIPRGGSDFFLTKFNPQGGIIWSTYVGGNHYESNAITVVDTQNDVYLLGATNSIDFPADNEYHGGDSDIILCKFTEHGSMEWSKYVGGSDEDLTGWDWATTMGAETDLNGNIIITFGTESEDILVKNAQFEEYSGYEDGFLTSYSSSGELLWSTYMGGEGTDTGYDVAVDSENRIIMGGRVHDPLLWNGPFPIINSFEYSFDTYQDGYISKWENNGSLIWSTLVSVIPYPDADNDDDGLTNYEEYKLCYDSSLQICTNPLDKDSDNDGLDDGYEVDLGINPVIQDSDGDVIPDGLEEMLGTNPGNVDTDGDGMDDHWEYIYFLNGSAPDGSVDHDGDGLSNLQEYQIDTRLSPRNPDTDGDGMGDGWEVDHGLDPVSNDQYLDSDDDGLSNFEEYQRELDPLDSDTDNDGMPDGWEVDHDLDPREDDDFKDADGDGLDNLSEYQLRRLGFKPDSETDVYVSIALIFVLIGSIIGYFIWRRKRTADARLMGYESYPDYKTSLKQGFTSAKERDKAFSSGFLSKQVQNAVVSSGYPSVTKMITDWDNVMTRLAEEIPAHQVTKHAQLINETTSPLNLEELKHNLDPFVKKLNQEVEQLRQIISLQQLIISIQENSKIPLLEGIREEGLNDYLTKFLSMVNELDQYHIYISNAINQRETWFKPWMALLTLIQITEDGMPISLDRIAEVVSCSETHAADLVKLLLSENKHIGEYDEQEKVYTKGVNIRDYIQMILSQLDDIEDN